MSVFIDAFTVVILLVILSVITDALVIYIAFKVAEKRPSPVKAFRYEAGNPPVGEVKFVLPMQYVGFLIMFFAVEPILAILLVIGAFGAYTSLVIALFIALLIPSVYAAYKLSLILAYPSRESLKSV